MIRKALFLGVALLGVHAAQAQTNISPVVKKFEQKSSDGSTVIKEIRHIEADLTSGVNWVSLGRFHSARVHKLTLSSSGHGGNSSAVIDFSVNYSRVAHFYRYDRLGQSNLTEFFFVKDTSSGYRRIEVFVRVKSNAPTTTTAGIKVVHEMNAGGVGWTAPSGNFPPTLEVEPVIAAVEVVDGIKTNGLIPGVHISENTYFEGEVYVVPQGDISMGAFGN